MEVLVILQELDRVFARSLMSFLFLLSVLNPLYLYRNEEASPHWFIIVYVTWLEMQ